MGRQLVLIEDKGTDWRLDEATRQRGRMGIARARQILAQAIRASAA